MISFLIFWMNRSRWKTKKQPLKSHCEEERNGNLLFLNLPTLNFLIVQKQKKPYILKTLFAFSYKWIRNWYTIKIKNKYFMIGICYPKMNIINNTLKKWTFGVTETPSFSSNLKLRLHVIIFKTHSELFTTKPMAQRRACRLGSGMH